MINLLNWCFEIYINGKILLRGTVDSPEKSIFLRKYVHTIKIIDVSVREDSFIVFTTNHKYLCLFKNFAKNYLQIPISKYSSRNSKWVENPPSKELILKSNSYKLCEIYNICANISRDFK